MADKTNDRIRELEAEIKRLNTELEAARGDRDFFMQSHRMAVEQNESLRAELSSRQEDIA